MRIAPGFGGIHLEDISAPECFEIERRLIEALPQPVMHDDVHGTAVVTLAAAIAACRHVGMRLDQAVVGQIGLGAAGLRDRDADPRRRRASACSRPTRAGGAQARAARSAGSRPATLRDRDGARPTSSSRRAGAPGLITPGAGPRRPGHPRADEPRPGDRPRRRARRRRRVRRRRHDRQQRARLPGDLPRRAARRRDARSRRRDEARRRVGDRRADRRVRARARRRSTARSTTRSPRRSARRRSTPAWRQRSRPTDPLFNAARSTRRDDEARPHHPRSTPNVHVRRHRFLKFPLKLPPPSGRYGPR